MPKSDSIDNGEAEIADTSVGMHGNQFHLFQPPKTAHRPGMDALLLAAAVPAVQSGLIADFGAGNGAVGMAILNRCKNCSVDFIELSENALNLIVQASHHPANAHIRDRMNMFQSDVSSARSVHTATQRAYGTYEMVVANPPFNTVGHRISPDAGRAMAHHGNPGDIAHWILSANTMLKPKGRVVFIVRPVNLDEILSASRGRFGKIQITPIHPKKTAPAKRLIISMIKASSAPLEFLPPFVVHKDNGEFTSHADAIFKGEAELCLQG